jgi:hypothetical protein
VGALVAGRLSRSAVKSRRWMSRSQRTKVDVSVAEQSVVAVRSAFRQHAATEVGALVRCEPTIKDGAWRVASRLGFDLTREDTDSLVPFVGSIHITRLIDDTNPTGSEYELALQVLQILKRDIPFSVVRPPH